MYGVLWIQKIGEFVPFLFAILFLRMKTEKLKGVKLNASI